MDQIIYRRRMLSSQDKKNIALCWYGSIDDTQNTFLTVAEISRRLNINDRTIRTFLRRLKEYGPRVFGNCHFKKTHQRIGNADVELLLLSEVYLKRWAALSIKERIE